MNVEDISGAYLANDLSELQAILKRRRSGDVNAFWLATESGGYPTLMILVKGDLVVLHYLPTADEPGLRSLGESEGGEFMDFSISPNPGDDVQEPSDAVVTLDAAWQAAKEFFDARTLPQSIRWVEL